MWARRVVPVRVAGVVVPVAANNTAVPLVVRVTAEPQETANAAQDADHNPIFN